MLESFGPNFMTRSYKAETVGDLDIVLDILSGGEFNGAQVSAVFVLVSLLRTNKI